MKKAERIRVCDILIDEYLKIAGFKTEFKTWQELDDKYKVEIIRVLHGKGIDREEFGNRLKERRMQGD